MSLTEFHSGYRVYSVAALKQVPFRLNTRDFHFDTEIIIQFKFRGFRILELPIPTYYGDEICYVNGMAYAWHVVADTLASRIHEAGLLYQRKYDVVDEGAVYDAKLDFKSSHSMAVDAVRPGARVLDLACGPGHVAQALAAKGCRVTGVDRVCINESRFADFIWHDLDDGILPSLPETFDTILLLDCLEHLNAPEKLLEEIRERLYSPETVLVLTAPNIGFVVTRLALLAGQFNYGRQGILDLTHKRLFTFGSLRRTLEQAGFVVTRVRGIPAPFPKAVGNGWLGKGLLLLNRALIGVWRRMFAYQIYLEARPLPPLHSLLARTLSSSRELAAGSRPSTGA